MIKEISLEDMLPIKAVEEKIWKMFDILRNNSIGLNDYHIILLFLSLYKEDKISKEFQFSQLHDNLDSQSVSFKKSNIANDYSKIFRCFASSLLNIQKNAFNDLIDVLFKIDKAILEENFSEIFDTTLHQITQAQGRYGGELIQPQELTRFICTLANLPKKAKVFNPFAGLASFGVCFDQGQDYFGQEINQKTWALGALRLKAYERPGNTKFVCDDSIINWPDHSEKFDLIVANPPFGMQLGEIKPYFRSIEQFLIMKGVNSLNNKGKLIALLPQGFLYRGRDEQRLREYLVEQDLIDTIITFPGGLLLNTGIPIMILVLSKSKKTPKKIRFINAKKFVVANGPREKKLNDYALNGLIYHGKENEDVIRFVDIENVRRNDYILSVPRYFQKQIEGVNLGEVLEHVKGYRGNLPKVGKLIKIRDLKDDKVDFTLDISAIELVELRRPDIQLISESCLLLSMRWRTLKPTFFEFRGEPIYISQDILSFKVDELLADKKYLINEIYAEYVQEQLEAYRLGSSIPYIHKDDLMKVVVKLPSLEEQRAKIQGIYEVSQKIKNLEHERNSLLFVNSLKQYNEFASLKHTLGRPRQNILDWSDNLLDFFGKKQEELKEFNKSFVEFYNIDIISVLKEIKHDVNFITDVLEKGENGLVLSEYEKQSIPLSEINSIINELSNNGFKFKIKKLLLKGNLKERGIYANKTLFKALLDNILTNANKHAYDKLSTANEVVIELTEVDDLLTIEIRNNGKPFPHNFDREKFITKYSTANTKNGKGIGGYDIHRIATDFGNQDWILSLNEDPFYPVKFKFQFPITLIF